MCSCDTEYHFTYEGTEYAYDTHGKAAAKRKELGAVGKAPIRARKKTKTSA